MLEPGSWKRGVMTTFEPSSSIISAATITVRPENHKELYLTISSLLELIRVEDGCQAYKFYGEVRDKNSFILIGEWETRTAWDNHIHSENFAVLLGSMKLLGNTSAVDFKLLSHVTDTEALTKARCSQESYATVRLS